VLVLFRHGSTEWSETGKHTGGTDVPLSETGRRQAERLRERVARYDFTLVLTSPLSRARDTSELAGLGERAQIEPDLRELDYGSYEGLTTDEIRERRPAWSVWRDGSPGGETPDDAGERADRVIARVDAGADTAALVAHGHVLRILAARWIEQDPRLGGRLWLGTAAVCELGYERERRAIWLWNDQHHLG
jgi:broad specificity phosphatase PhoE